MKYKNAALAVLCACALFPFARALPAFAAGESEKPKIEESKPAPDAEQTSAAPSWVADGSVYSPGDCEFEVVFPEAPYKTQRCDPVEKDKNCSEMNSYTKVFGIDSTVTYNVSCTPVTGDMYDKYDDDVMRTVLLGMTRDKRLTTSQTGFAPMKEAKMAVVLGSGKTENGQDDLIYTAQLWIGHKTVFTLEGELRGKYDAEADRLFAEILKTARLKGSSTPIDANGNPIGGGKKAEEKKEQKADEKSSDKKTEKTPEKTGDK